MSMAVSSSDSFQARCAEDDPTTLLTRLAVLNTTTFPTLAEAVEAYLAFVMDVIGVRSAFVANLDADFMHVLDARDDDGCGIPADGVVPIEDTFCQYVRATGEPVVVTDAAQDARVMHVPTRTTFHIGSYLGVPLILSNGAIYGTLCALDPQPRQFSQLQIALVRIIGRHLGALIEREQLGRADRAVERDLGVALGALDARSTLLTIVAHDIRNPISHIMGFTEILQEGGRGPLLPEQHDGLDRIHSSARFINRLINDLLDAATAETGRLTILSGAFDPCVLGQSVLESCQTQAARGITLHVHSAATLPTMIGDADRLRQILLNFMGNALRYTTAGTITLRITAQDDGVQFTVEDTGSGISHTAQASIWQLHTRQSHDGHGLCLGLYIVQCLAQVMRGTVGMTSTPGVGSSFWVRLPLHGPPPSKARWDDERAVT